MKKISALGAGLAALALVAAGCSGAPKATNAAPQGNNHPATSAPAAAPATSAPAPSPTKTSSVKEFDQTMIWDDGLAVTVSAPVPFTPGQWAAGTGKFPNSVVFTVTVVNKTGKEWDPVLFHATVQSGNQEGSAIFDSAQLGDRPTTKLLDGRETTFKMAFGVANPADLVMEVSPDFTHKSGIYQKK